MVTIREMNAADRDSIIFIHKQSIYGLCKGNYSEPEMKAWAGFFTPVLFDAGMKDESNVGVVAVDSDTIIGFGFFNADAGELRALYILPQYIGHGAGSRIMARLEDMAKEKQISRLSLQSTINAVGFYQKFGYQNIKTEMHQINDEVSIACVRMEKDLDRIAQT